MAGSAEGHLGEDKIDGNALLEYFAPLKTWLDQQNAALAAAEKK
jgi:peptidyl-dipeptidase A